MPRKREKKPALRWGDGTIRERKTKDGHVRYEARWYEESPSGEPIRRSRTVDTQEQAEALLRSIGSDKREGRFVPESRLTVLDAVNEYADRKARNGDWRPNTVGTNRVAIDRYIAPGIGDQLVTRISHRRIQQWIDSMIDRGISRSFTASTLSIVKGALGQLQRLGVIDTNPALGVSIGKRDPRRTATWSLEEVRKLLATAQDDPRLHALYLLALTTGMRPGELRALRWHDIDLTDGLVRCRRTITRDADHHQYIGDTTKTGRARLIAVSPDVVDALRRWQSQQKRNSIAAATWYPDDIVFDRGDGRFLPDATFQDQHTRLVKRAGISELNPHGMRHTAATHMLEEGVHPKIVQEILGHASIAMTMDRYSHISTDLQKAAAGQVSKRLLSHATTSDPKTDDAVHSDASIGARDSQTP